MCQYPLLGRIYSTTQGLVGNPVFRSWDFYSCHSFGHFGSHQGGKSSSKDALAFHANVIVAKIHQRTRQNFSLHVSALWVSLVISDRYHCITWYHNVFFLGKWMMFWCVKSFEASAQAEALLQDHIAIGPADRGIQSLWEIEKLRNSTDKASLRRTGASQPHVSVVWWGGATSWCHEESSCRLDKQDTVDWYLFPHSSLLTD